MRLGSDAYLEEMQRRSNADERYRKLAHGDSDSYSFVLKADPDTGVSEPLILGYELEDGCIAEAWQGERSTSFTISGPYGVWVDILRGELDAERALVTGELGVEGNLLKLIRRADATVRWVEILRTIPTEFEGGYAEYSFPGEG